MDVGTLLAFINTNPINLKCVAGIAAASMCLTLAAKPQKPSLNRTTAIILLLWLTTMIQGNFWAMYKKAGIFECVR
jgi:hypothetical protein